jgi:glycolate oxidase iron-sulfur subunit
MDSPRGRIDLMRGLAEGRIGWTDSVVAHFDRCLGCMGCMPACPSGVRYDVLIEETRAKAEANHRRGLFDRIHRALLFSVLPYPERLAAAARALRLYAGSGLRGLVRRTGAARIFGSRLAQLEALAPDPNGASADLPALTPAAPPRRLRVALLAGCVQRVFFPEVNAATLDVLSAEGCDVLVPEAQGCCGALSMHAGRHDEGLDFARRLVDVFSDLDVDAIVVNAAGCGSNLKDYGRLLAADPRRAEAATRFAARVRDVSELLAALPPAAPRRPISGSRRSPLRVAYHDACHLANAQGVRAEPRALLSAIPGVELVEIPGAESESCCGSAGIYNLVEPESADEIGTRKAEQVAAARADLLASANPGCTLQIRKLLRARGVELPARHPIELVAASIAGRKILEEPPA